MDWSGGYVADIGYISGFYRELGPGYLSFVARLQGEPAPDPAQPFSYLELGCGQGLGTNLLAAANPHGRFVGIDLLPAHIANARDLAAAAQLPNVTYHEADFFTAAEWPETALPSFDYIVLHGIYAWISPANRRALVRLIGRWLKPGGLVYISYNAMPGWASLIPLQRLLREHAARNPGRSDRQIQAGLAFSERLREAGLGYFDEHPAAASKLDGMEPDTRSTTYLAHEYLNSAAEPLFFSDVAGDLSAAKLEFVGSADLIDHYDVLTLPESLRAVVAEESDPTFRELLRDYGVNRVFRRDVFVKGSRPGTAVQQDAALLDTRVVPLRSRSRMSARFTTHLGELTGQERIYRPLMDVLARGPVSIAELIDATGVEASQLVQACAVLTATEQIHPQGALADPEPARRLADVLAERLLADEPHGHLPAPAIGNGIALGDVEICALAVLRAEGGTTADSLARAIWRRFRACGRRMLRDGELLEGDRANLRELRHRARGILRDQVPVWQGLGLL